LQSINPYFTSWLLLSRILTAYFIKVFIILTKENFHFRLSAAPKTGSVPTLVTPSPKFSSTTTPDPVSSERVVNPRFGMDERSVNTLSQKLTVPLQLQLDSVSDGLKEEYWSLLGSQRDDLYNLKMETVGFHGTLDQKLVNALRILFNEVSDETVNNTIHPNNLDDTGHPSNHPVVNWIITGIWFWLFLSSKFVEN
jgi:hypothetical protein